MKKIWIGLGLASALAIGAAYHQRANIALALVETIANERMQDPVAALPDGLHVLLCGTGSPFPDPDRSAPCTMVIAGQQQFLFDVGGGAAKQIANMGFGTGALEAVFLTHFHSDHIDGLGELLMTRWAQHTGNKRLKLHGPQGTAQVLEGFTTAYAQDTHYRIAHHGDATMDPMLAGANPVEFDATETGFIPVFDNGAVRIQAFSVNHHPIHPAVGYRIEYKNRSVVISGDTKADPRVEQAAANADLLVHEALSPELVGRLADVAQSNERRKLLKIFQDIPDYHAAPEQVAELAKNAEVKHVVLTHIVPPLPLAPLREIFLGESQSIFKGSFKIGNDGDFISLPANSADIEYNRRW